MRQENEWTFKLLGNKVCKKFFTNTLGVKNFNKISQIT